MNIAKHNTDLKILTFYQCKFKDNIVDFAVFLTSKAQISVLKCLTFLKYSY